MCKFCDYNSPYNEVFVDTLNGNHYIEIKTSHWDEYNDDWDYERLYINYCPYCGEKLSDIK